LGKYHYFFFIKGIYITQIQLNLEKKIYPHYGTIKKISVVSRQQYKK